MIEPGNLCNRLYALAREHNAQDVMLELSGVPMLIVQRHESARQILQQRAANYRKNMAWFRQALGASRFSEEGHAWQIRQQLTHAHFTRFDRAHTCALASRHAEQALLRMQADSRDGALAINDRILRELTASVLVENFLGLDFATTGIDLGVLSELMEHGSAYSFVPAGHAGSDFQQSVRRLPALRREVLRQLHVLRDESLPCSPMLAGMRAADADPGNDIVLEHELLTFLAAGAESSASALGWACYLLARHPELQQQLHRAVDTVDEAQGWPALARCSPLADFISEALRMFPPTPVVARLANTADDLGSHDVAPDQAVLISFIGIGHDARRRANPWAPILGDSAHGPTSGNRMAFSVGPHVCGGKLFAMVELMAALSVFLRHARFELSSDAAPEFQWKAQMFRQGGQPVVVHPR